MKSMPIKGGRLPERTKLMNHRQKITCLVGICLTISAVCAAAQGPAQLQRDYNVKPVPFNHVHVTDGLWTPRLETNRTVTIPYAFEKCEETDRISNFEKAAGLRDGKFEGTYFNDSDVYKIMEGAAYSLQVNPDRMMRLYLDQLIRVMAAAQWEDGYLFTFYSVPDRQLDKLWTNIGGMHEQYCAGHMYEAAVAHFQVTGEKTFLDVAIRNADLMCKVFNPNARTDPPGHQEIEIALCKLYRATGDEKYLDQAKFFLDQRGRKGRRGPDGKGGLYGQYSQDHIPVTEQTTAVGHSVRAAYLYTGMADVAALTGNMEYIRAIDAIWRDVVGTKLYLTGGIGAAGGHEGFGGHYELPNMTAYCETCASIANVLWNHRMFLMTGEGKYIDVLERTLYNAALSGISMSGDLFFYPCVLESIGQHARSPWFGCACCPSNVARFIPSVPGMVYASKDSDLYVNLYMGTSATIEVADTSVVLTQQTQYPWHSDIRIGIEPQKEAAFAVMLRIPGWARNEPVPSDLYTYAGKMHEKVILKINGRATAVNVDKGYVRIERRWKQGDTIELNLPMPVRRVLSHPEVVTNKGKVALERGPIVYCLEGPDNGGEVLDIYIPDEAKLSTEFRPDLLNGVMIVNGVGRTAKRMLDGSVVPHTEKAFTAIPYYAWAHRGRAHMTVWPARTPEAARPRPADTLAFTSKTTASYVHVSLDAIKDQIVPVNSADSSGLQLDFWPHKGTTEWVQFEWDGTRDISCVKVYWFDDTGRGECHLPASWRILYRDADGKWQPAKNKGPYTAEKDAFNQVNIEPVKTSAIKLEVVLQDNWSAGIHEVIIE
ncbi:MAG: glycoside hydrolase family 127 protein [Phycisphaerae bacterium]|nr:glycoside hydrolase family 127 protein [Phycisphaerae bacterium]